MLCAMRACCMFLVLTSMSCAIQSPLVELFRTLLLASHFLFLHMTSVIQTVLGV
jgi:hypothetical protein